METMLGKKPYKFVPFNKEISRTNPIRHNGENNKKAYSGKLKITIETLTPIHIGQGSYSFDKAGVIVNFIRRNNSDWKKNSMVDCGYKCVLSGERFDEIHHLYGFNLILEETFETMQINIKSDINDYTHDEMMDILKCFREIQSKYPLGVCLTKEIHNLFHSQYGYGNNTIEQWNEFVNNYKMIA